MALRKKGTRIIDVDGTTYRWLASGVDEGIHVIIELAENPGQQLFTRFDYHEIRFHGRYRQQQTITPDVIRRLIEYGLSSGWTPEKISARFTLTTPERLIIKNIS